MQIIWFKTSSHKPKCVWMLLYHINFLAFERILDSLICIRPQNELVSKQITNIQPSVNIIHK